MTYSATLIHGVIARGENRDTLTWQRWLPVRVETRVNLVKKPPIFFDEKLALQSLRDGESGAELHVLEGLAHVVLSGKKVSPMFQAVVNAIVAKAVLSEKFPANARGTPANFMVCANGWSIANRYLELRDGGMNYADAVEQVADEFPKDDGNKMSDRQIERLVKENKSGIERRMGGTVKARKIFRARAKQSADIEISAEDAECVARILAPLFALQAVVETHLENETQRDCLADLDRLIAQSLKLGNPDDIK